MDILFARLIHIGTGVLWAGAGILLARYLEPAARATGEHGQAYLQELQRRGLQIYVNVTGLAAILSGLYLYWHDSNGLQLSWVTSPPGATLTIGALSAIVAFVGGLLAGIPIFRRSKELRAQIAASGGIPSAEQRAEMARIVDRLAAVGKWVAVLLVLTVLCMAGARYVGLVVG